MWEECASTPTYHPEAIQQHTLEMPHGMLFFGEVISYPEAQPQKSMMFFLARRDLRLAATRIKRMNLLRKFAIYPPKAASERRPSCIEVLVYMVLTQAAQICALAGWHAAFSG